MSHAVPCLSCRYEIEALGGRQITSRTDNGTRAIERTFTTSEDPALSEGDKTPSFDDSTVVRYEFAHSESHAINARTICK